MNINVPIPVKDYKVLVKCATYNQSKYICDALNGFAIQKTKFPFICIVVDDASKDGNQEVIRQYANDNCDMSIAEISEDDISTYIRVSHKSNSNCDFLFCLLKVNLYSKPEKQEIYKPYRAVCEYEASCEGDDYWILSEKLQIQCDYLDSHPKSGLCYTKANILNDEKKEISGIVGFKYDNSIDIYKKNLIVTLTVCFRISLLKDYYETIPSSDRTSWLMGDYPLWLFIFEKSEIYYIDIISAVYRVNRLSLSRPQSIEKKIEFIGSTKSIQLYFANRNGFENFRLMIEKKYIESAIDSYKYYNCRRKGIRLIIFSEYLSFVEKIKYLIHLLCR